jgi:DNA-binding MarR family transcriptional regulator
VTGRHRLDDVEMDAWRGLMNAHSRLVSRLDTSLQESQGISLCDYEVLVHLSESSDGRLRMSDLAQRLNLSPSGLTRRLDGLVAVGWVSRSRCSEDRRVSYAVLMPEGKDRADQAAQDHVDQIRRFFVDLLSRRQLSDLARTLAPVIDGPCD